jgi:hypothetical protein
LKIRRIAALDDRMVTFTLWPKWSIGSNVWWMVILVYGISWGVFQNAETFGRVERGIFEILWVFLPAIPISASGSFIGDGSGIF